MCSSSQGVRKLSDDEKKTAPKLSQVPFQLQITYVAQDGTKAMRVYTKVQEFTHERQKAEENMLDRNLVWSNAAQKISNFALGSNMKAAKYKEKAQSKMASDRHWDMPEMYAMQQACVRNVSSEMNSNAMTDTQANMFHYNKKMNRKNLK